MLVDGNKIADALYGDMRKQFALFASPARLAVVVCDAFPVTESFVAAKKRSAERLGVVLVRYGADPSLDGNALCALIKAYAEDADGVIVQLPLPANINIEEVLACIPPEKDVDGIGLSEGTKVLPPVALAVEEIFRVYAVEVRGKNAVVIGSGRLVGVPVAGLLERMGADVTVIKRGDSLEALGAADIIVSGAGEPGLVKPNMIKKGVVLVDAGTSESGGKIAGDADPACAKVASLFTPVPGGVGPIAVAMIFKNLIKLVGR